MKKTFLLFIFISVFYNNTQAQERIIQDWVSYYQFFDVKPYIGKKFRVSAAIKKMNADKDSKTSIWVRIDKKGGEDITFFQNNASKINITDKWKIYTVEGKIKEESNILNFGAYCKLNGDFYFDDFKVQYFDKGTWKDIKIENPSFEKEEDILLPSWNYGISPQEDKVKGFDASYVKNDSFHGKKALKISGKGIILDKD